MSDKKRTVLLLVIGTLIILCVVMGFSRAYMKKNIQSDSVTEVNLNSCAKLMLMDTGNSINLTNTAPMSDNKGMQTTPYEFTIKSACDQSVNYKLYLGVISGNTLSEQNVKYAIKDATSGSVVVTGIIGSQTNGSSDFDASEQNQISKGLKGTVSNIYVAMNSAISKNSEKKYQLFLWVDSSVGNETMNQIFTVGVMAKSFENVELFSDKIKAQYTGTQGENGLYYHNASLENGAGDNSYRYAGSNDVVNNYVCFGSTETTCPEDNLYRIIGVFGDQVKLIKATVATSTLLGTDGAYYSDTAYRWYGDSYNNTWSHSLLNTTNLNTNYITNIGSIWANKIATTTWQVGGMSSSRTNTAKQYYEVEVGASKTDTPYSAKIGLMYVSDYGYAASSEHWTKALYDYDNATTKANNWMYLGQIEWTISRIADDADYAFYVLSLGYVNNHTVNSSDAVRPVFYLNSDVSYLSGTGTSNDSYRIS